MPSTLDSSTLPGRHLTHNSRELNAVICGYVEHYTYKFYPLYSSFWTAMGLSRVLGCFTDSDAQTLTMKKRRKRAQERPRNRPPREGAERPNRVAPIPALGDKTRPTSMVGMSSGLARHVLEDSGGADHARPGPVATTAAGYDDERWSMGAVARRISQLPNQKSPPETSHKEKSSNLEFQDPQLVWPGRVPKEVHDHWAPLGTGIRAAHLFDLPTVDIQQFRAAGSGVAEADEAEGVIVEPYIVPTRPRPR
jgi:hypothetical protein